MMDKEYSSKIIQNLDFIATNIGSVTQLLNLLLANSVISRFEWETIESLTPRHKAVTELANLICRKDPKSFPVFIKCLHESGNEVVAELLEQPIDQHEISQIVPNSDNQDIAQRQGTEWKFWSKILITLISVLPIVIYMQLYKHMDTPLPISLANTSQPIWFEITAPTTFYVGREKEMILLEEYWNRSVTQKSLSVVAVTGLGGVGKTELVKNYAKMVYENFRSHCIWIKAETNQSVEESFKNLAEKTFKISVTDYLGRERIFLEIVAEIYEKLFGQKVLLVFDNIENYDLPVLQLLFRLSSQLPPTVLKPFVITTSRLVEAKNYFGTQCNLIDLQVLTKHSAEEFFNKSLSLNEHPEDSLYELVERLCERLQFLPLAMQQASAYINQRSPYYGTLSEAINDYLNKIEEQSKTLLNHKLPQYEALENISSTTFLTWKITFNKIRNSADGGDVAMSVMNVISFLSPDNIPTHMVTNILRNMGKVSNSSKVNDFFELLRKYSMITYSGVDLISVHRLVQEVTRIDLKEREEFLPILNGIAECMLDVLKADETSSKEHVHVQMVWLHLRKDKEAIEQHGRLLWWICNNLFYSGKYKDLLDFSSESGSLLESLLGKNSRWTLQMNYWRGIALTRSSQYSESLEVLKYVRERQKDTFGTEDDDYLNTANDVGVVYYLLQNYDEALNIYYSTLEISERIFGTEHRKSADLMSGIAQVLADEMKLEEAMEMYEEVLEMKERVLGKEHPSTLATKHSIASTLKEQNKFEEAVKLYDEVLEVHERVLGKEHPSTLATKHNIASTLKEQNKFEEAVKLYDEVLEVNERMLEKEHPRTLKTKHNIASTLGAQNKLEEAMKLYEEVLEVQERMLGKEHPHTLTTKRNIAVTNLNQKDYREALKKFKDVLEIQERVLALNHPNTLKTKYFIANTYYELGREEDCLQLAKEVYKYQAETLGLQHPDTVKTEKLIRKCTQSSLCGVAGLLLILIFHCISLYGLYLYYISSMLPFRRFVFYGTLIFTAACTLLLVHDMQCE